MSVESMAIALHHSRAKGTAKLVLIGIANHDGDGGAWPSVDTLAKYAGVHRRNVQRALQQLEELHEIEIVRNGGGDHSIADTHRPNLYRVILRCPSTCDRTTQHRTSRKPVLSLFEGGVADSSPHGAGVALGVASAPPEPPTKPYNSSSTGNHLPRTCPKGHDLLPEGGYCVMGCNVRRHLEAVPS